ncbi:hypothetical protein AMS68_006136 [Peltaster fructicola]|uniref:Zinc finger C2H2 LYAR-type domain-containing protein n=1 Tax=Peltaster fructicola TaxID=286661 RepID=A0A6H0Y181_9PEZI|nr:hypothetical protein AMS68_006136 [Peltaster fructicola]
MVSFSCEACGDVLTKKKLDPHRNQCRGASFTCLDCMIHFQGLEYRTHTSCISEAQKYQGHLFRDKKANKGEKRKSVVGKDDMVPKKAYVEDAPEDGEGGAVAVIDVPPRAPTPPPANEALPANVNVFDFLITEDTPTTKNKTHAVQPADESKMITDSQHSQMSNGNGTRYLGRGYSYGNAPVEPSFERYDSWTRFPADSQEVPGSQQHSQSMAPPAYLTKIVTPGPDRERKHGKDEKSDKKRKRQQVDDLDLTAMRRPSSRDEPMTDAPARILHTGLTGGLTRLVTDSSFYDDRIDAGPTPISPIKRSKRNGEEKDTQKRHSSYTSTKVSSSSRQPTEGSSRHRHSDYHEDRQGKSRRRRSPSSSSDDERQRHRRHSKVKAIDFQPYMTRAELFLSFITKGPDSERGCSINKALKRYHRERDTKGDEKEDDDKELWKSLRLRKNERGEIVLFVA